MCRSIKMLHNFDPPATDDEIRASSLQFVRKLSGFTRPAKTNEVAFARAVDQVALAVRELLETLVTKAPARDREIEATKARARSAARSQSAARRGSECRVPRARRESVRGPPAPCARRRRSPRRASRSCRMLLRRPIAAASR